MLGFASNNYRLASRCPRIWQVNLVLASFYSVSSSAIAYSVFVTVTSDLKANSIPDTIFISFRLFLFASAIATLYWLLSSTRHFRVGVAGYKIASPPLLLLFVVIGSLWIAPFLYAYCVCSSLKETASLEDASVGYMRLLRAAALFNADAHNETLETHSEVAPLYPLDRFTEAFAVGIAQGALRPIEMFAPAGMRNVLSSLLRTSLPECSKSWSTTSRSDATAAAQAAAAQATDKAKTEEEKELARKEKANRIDRIDADFERASRVFRQCLDDAVRNTNLDLDDIARGFRTAQRNAYLIQYAYKSFGLSSADYLLYVNDPKFAAPDLFPFGLGDLTVLSAIVWIAFLVSVFYLAGEYVDSSSFASVVSNVVLIIFLVVLVLSSFGSPPSIPRLSNPPFSHDAVASTLHWPSIIVLGIGALGLLRTLVGPSTKATRFAVLATFLCLPLAIGIEALNAVNTLTSVDYRGGNCPRVGWVVADRVHCVVYSVWQPFVRDCGVWLANHVHWPQFWLTVGGRASISAALSILVAWPVSSVLLLLLKREYVRPRDK